MPRTPSCAVAKPSARETVNAPSLLMSTTSLFTKRTTLYTLMSLSRMMYTRLSSQLFALAAATLSDPSGCSALPSFSLSPSAET